MKSFLKKRIFSKNIITVLTGAAAGALNGFLGSGGGIVLLGHFLRRSGGKGKDAERDAFAGVVASVLPLCAVSAVVYSDRGMGNINELYQFAVPAIIGGAIGALLTDKLNTGLLRKIFAVIITAAGINMIL